MVVTCDNPKYPEEVSFPTPTTDQGHWAGRCGVPTEYEASLPLFPGGGFQAG